MKQPIFNINRDWYECTKCKNQGYVMPGNEPDPKIWGGCNCEYIDGVTGPHDWQPLKDYQNTPTYFQKFPEEYFSIE